MTETTRSWAKLSQPSANAAGMLISAANRVRSIATITGRLRRNSTHGPSGTATTAPTASPVAARTETSAGPACSTRIAISGNAPNPMPEPYTLPPTAPRTALPAPPGRSCPDQSEPGVGGANTHPAGEPHRCVVPLRSVGMDLDAVRTFVAVVDTGRFAAAADDLSVTQQAVSKRIAALEKDLAVRLFTRTARGARLTIDGQAFLPHARDLLQAAERAAASVRP